VIFIDSNVLIDIWGADQQWKTWSLDAVAKAADLSELRINQIILAEFAPRLVSLTAFLDRIASLDIVIEPFSDEAAYLAGVAFQKYRKSVRSEKSVLPDFFIGGHAQLLGAAILTRDSRFYRSYFPEVPLIAPEKDRA
jgi:predicted nucleic acid-binding protein